MRNFFKLLEKRWAEKNTLLCVGLDPDYSKIPQHLKIKFTEPVEIILEFNKAIIDATADLVCVFKPQFAFYAAQGEEGISALKKTIGYIHEKHPDIPVILDAKRGDVGNTAGNYAMEIFDFYAADAVTINPYLGYDSVQPFSKYKEKGIFILCRTSNPSAKDFQDIVDKKTDKPLYQLVAQKAKEWNENENIGLVVGATYPQDMKTIREIVGDQIPFLIPGLGAQGGKPEDIVQGFNKQKTGVIASTSRSVIFAGKGEDFADKSREEAKKLRDEINQYR